MCIEYKKEPINSVLLSSQINNAGLKLVSRFRISGVHASSLNMFLE